jgi:molybdate transport system substrate-binding protein
MSSGYNQQKSSIRRIVIMALLVWGLSCGLASAASPELLVSAAMSLKEVLTQLAGDFEKQHPDVKISLNFAGSGQLRAQIENGAPVDIFLAASVADMDGLAAKKLIVGDTRTTLAKNQLVLIKPKAAKMLLNDLADLKKNEVKKIAIGNPETVPAGRYARETLSFYKLYDQLQPKFVFGENVRQVLDYVGRAEVEAGFVYATDIRADSDRVKVVQLISEKAHRPISYPGAVIQSSPRPDLAKNFLTFLASSENRKVWQSYGFH